MRLLVIALSAGILFAALIPAIPAARGAAVEGFFRVEKINGRWWFIDPAGQRFISKGVDSVRLIHDYIPGPTPGEKIYPYAAAARAKYGSAAAWEAAQPKRLLGWGFNTLGAWSDAKLAKVDVDGKHLAYAPILDLGAGFVAASSKGQAWLHGIFPDVFDPKFETFAFARAAQRCTPLKNDRAILGWFTDNELRWGPDWRGSDELITLFLNLPHAAPGRAAAIDLLRQRYADIAAFNAVWGTAFTSWDALAAADKITAPFERKKIQQNAAVARTAADDHGRAFLADADAFLALLAERYFRITAAAIKQADPNHLNFGARFAYVPAEPVIRAAAAHVDAISFNCYDHSPNAALEQYAAFGKPLIIGEFAFRGADSGLPNTRGAGVVVPTQTARAAAFATFATAALKHPSLVGYHWFEFCDEPKEGRFDGENSNYGIVTITDEPYEALLKKMMEISADAERLHGG